MSYQVEKGLHGHSNPWGSSRDANEGLIKLILSRNLPILRSPIAPTEFGKDTDPVGRKNNTPKVTLYDGYTNSAIAARFNKNNNRVAALVYCSAGMIGGQLSSPGGTHFAQEEGTLVENPIIFTTITDTLEKVHNTPRTVYPLYRFDQLDKILPNMEKAVDIMKNNNINTNNNDQDHHLDDSEISNLPNVFTPAYGFLIDNIIPLQLDGNAIRSSPFNSRDNNPDKPSPYISYIMQAAIHLGLTFEDEYTNYMFTTNPFINSPAQSANARRFAQRLSRHWPSLSSKCKNIPTDAELNSSNDAFNAFSSDPITRTGLRNAMKALLFSNFDFTQKLDNNNKDNDSTIAEELFLHYNDNYKQIEQAYLDAVRCQLINQFKLTQLNNKNVLIIGAFGCGVYNNNWKQIAEVYRDVAANYGGHLTEIVICNKLDHNNRKGMELFAKIIAEGL